MANPYTSTASPDGSQIPKWKMAVRAAPDHGTAGQSLAAFQAGALPRGNGKE
jgi:hypothetical protein